jgi:hypothetical protein
MLALWPWDFQLFADGPNRPFFDFAMARDAGDFVQGGVEPNAMSATFAIQNATLAPTERRVVFSYHLHRFRDFLVQ